MAAISTRRCEPGVTREQLNAHLRDMGLFFPIDPGANASLGGMAATRASGTNAVRYGTMRDNVISLRAVMPDGQVIKTGNRARKSSAGYDLTRLIVGSEGTLGIITELTLAPAGRARGDVGGDCFLSRCRHGLRSDHHAAMQTGIPMARIELLDAQCVEAINNYSKTDFPVSPLLLLEFHGSLASVGEQAEMLRRNRQGLRRNRL